MVAIQTPGTTGWDSLWTVWPDTLGCLHVWNYGSIGHNKSLNRQSVYNCRCHIRARDWWSPIGFQVRDAKSQPERHSTSVRASFLCWRHQHRRRIQVVTSQ